MNTKGFKNISAEECLIVAQDIQRNADSKWQAAKTLAETKDYGTAISIAIVSIEEQLKALILCADGHGFQFRHIDGMKNFFNNHTLRYITAYYIFVMAVYGEDLFRMIYTMRGNPEEGRKWIDLYRDDKEIVYKKMGRYMMRKLIQFQQEMEWFSRVDLFRQEGFYADYGDSLKTPLVIPERTYLETMQRLVRVRLVASEAMHAFENKEPEFIAELQKLQSLFVKDNMSTLISNGIKAIGRNRKDPFFVIREWFTYLRNTES